MPSDHPPPRPPMIPFDKLGSFSIAAQFPDFRPELVLGRSEVLAGEVDGSFFLKYSRPSLVPAPPPTPAIIGRHKRPRSVRTDEEAECQRIAHIAVERNRRRQMKEYLRVLRSLIPGSYVERGDQASIIGGAAEFLRDLEKLVQCLESQKRRRLHGYDSPQPPFWEEVAENNSCLADVEVRLLGFDAMIKILSRRRRPGQLTETIATLEDLHFSILHTNITAIDQQTILYSFSVKITSEKWRTAEDIASSIHRGLSCMEASTLYCRRAGTNQN